MFASCCLVAIMIIRMSVIITTQGKDEQSFSISPELVESTVISLDQGSSAIYIYSHPLGSLGGSPTAQLDQLTF